MFKVRSARYGPSEFEVQSAKFEVRKKSGGTSRQSTVQSHEGHGQFSALSSKTEEQTIAVGYRLSWRRS